MKLSQISKIGSRFTSHVYPGETLSVRMWNMNPQQIYYETKIKERGGLTALKGLMSLNQKRGFSRLIRKVI